MVYGVVLAGGVGSRMGGDKPKQYLTVKDKPIIIYTIEKFISVPQLEKILVLCPSKWVEHTKNLIAKHIAPAADRVAVIEGGSTRNETIMNAIRYIENEGNLSDKVNGQYDIIVANIVADIIMQFNPQVAQFLKPGGTYITGGIIDVREDEVLASFAANGFTVQQRFEDKGWLVFVLKHA